MVVAAGRVVAAAAAAVVPGLGGQVLVDDLPDFLWTSWVSPRFRGPGVPRSADPDEFPAR